MMWDELLSPDLFEKIAAGKVNHRFYPLFSQRTEWAKIVSGAFKKTQKEAVLLEADALLSQPLEALSAYDYFRFTTEGNRALFEKRYFKRRSSFGTLVMALCLTGNKEKYFPAVVDYLAALTAEPFWCAPAHVVRDGDPMPMAQNAERVDLFASETAVQVALALQILQEELKALSPRFLRFCKKAVLDKVVLPVLDKFDDPSKFVVWAHAIHNWGPWCAGNVLCAAALLLDDPQQLADLVRKLNSTCAGFYAAAPEDGYCPEGPSYWRKAAVSLFACCRFLERLVPGSVDGVWRDPKFRRMGEFGALMVIHGRDQVLCCDAGHVADCGIDAAQIYEYGEKIQSPVLQKFAVNRLAPNPRTRKFTPAEGAVSRVGTGNRLEMLLTLFFALPDNPESVPEAPLPEVSLWENRMAILRHADGFSASLKAGTNGESHNHNDLGHFTVYDRDRPLVIDLGTGMYSRKNFSSERYQLYYTNSMGHNALRFGEHGQIAGGEFRAALSVESPDTVTADLREAYPDAAGLKHYTRTLHCTQKELCIRDHWELAVPGKAFFTLYSPQQTVLRSDGTLDFGGGVICIVQGACCRAVEPLAVSEIPLHWGEHLLRLEFEAGNGDFSLKFQYQDSTGR